MSGYTPASNLTGNLPQSTVIHYDKLFVKNLKANTPFVRCTKRRPLPMKSGNQYRLYMYQSLPANISQVSEGTVGSGIAVAVSQTTATIGQYADYCSVSDYALSTAIDPTLENIQTELSYRAALSVNTLTRNTTDGASAVDSSVAISKAYNSPLVRTDITTAVQSLLGRNVMPFETAKNRFCGVIHPFAVGDILNDSANNSMVDILKRTVEGQEKLFELPGEDEIDVIDFGGCVFYQSSIVTQTPNYLGHAGVTALRTYIYGDEGVTSISLGTGTEVGDGRNLKVWLRKLDEPSLPDPSRVIGGFTSYNMYFVTTLPPDTTMRVRYIDAPSNIS